MAGQQVFMHQRQGGRFMHALAMEGMGLVQDRAKIDAGAPQTADHHAGATPVHA
jgi:hypothetical protein